MRTDTEIVHALQLQAADVRGSERVLIDAVLAHVEEGVALSPAIRDLAEGLLEALDARRRAALDERILRLTREYDALLKRQNEQLDRRAVRAPSGRTED